MKKSLFAILISLALIFSAGAVSTASFAAGVKAPVKKAVKKEVKKEVKKAVKKEVKKDVKKTPPGKAIAPGLQKKAEPKKDTGSTAPAGNGATAPAAAQTVTIKDFAFSPADLTVKKGTTVIWVNQDSPKHNAFSSTAGGPQGPLLATGEKYTFKAEQVGSFDYICQPHPFMKGKVTVTE